MIDRFTRAERAYHWAVVAAVTLLGTTGIVIWLDLIDWRWHGKEVLPNTHVWLGGGMLVLATVAFLLLRRRRIEAAPLRFNSGQRLNLLAMRVLLTYMVASGGIAWFSRSLGLTKHAHHLVLQSHLFSAALIGLMVVAHLVMVFVVRKNRGIWQAMVKGRVPAEVARTSAPHWWDALQQPESQPAPALHE